MPVHHGRGIVTEVNTCTSSARVLPAAALLLVAAVPSGCGDDDGSGSDDAAVCSSVDALKSSVAGLTDIPLDLGALDDLQSGLKKIQSDLGTVKDDAGDEFATEVDAVEQATADLGSTIDAAVSAPSLQTVSKVGTSLEGLGTSLTSLTDSVKSTC
jgi:hypothetical protein